MSSNLAAYLSGTQDPSAVATYGETGQVFIQTGVTGFKFYQKQDNGLTTNWVLLSTGPSMSFTGLGECIDDNDAVKAAIAAKKAQAASVVENTGVTATLQGLINAAVDGDVIEIQSNGPYGAITIPTGVGITLRAGAGFLPVFTAANAVTLSNGATNLFLIGLKFASCTTVDANARGSAINMVHQAIVSNIYVSNCEFFENTGSSVMLCYHQSTGGDSYANPYNVAELSNGFFMVDCNFLKGSSDPNEGGAYASRGWNNVLIRRCVFDSGDGTSFFANDGWGRGVNCMSSMNVTVEDSVSKNSWLNSDAQNTGEGFKFDSLAAEVGFSNSALIQRCVVVRNRKGIVADDRFTVQMSQCLVMDCKVEGFLFRKATTFGSATQCIAMNNGKGFEIQAPVLVGSVSLGCCLSFKNVTDYSILNGYQKPTSNLEGSRSEWFKYLYFQDENVRYSTAAAVSVIDKSDYIVITDNAASVVTLPTGSNNMEFIIKAVQGATVNPSGGNTVEGGDSLALAALGFARLRFLNGNWYRIG